MTLEIDKFGLIVGAMKCGTTSLFEYLAQHPQIAACKEKEPNFFSERKIWERGISWYQGLWDWQSGVHKIALEASTSYSQYTKFPKVVPRIAGANINAKFIFIMRNPIERIESHHTYARIRGYKVGRKPLSEGIDKELIELSSYGMQIGKYYCLFPAENILLLLFEDLKEKPQETVRSVCQFLEVDADYPFPNLDRAHNPSQGQYAVPSLWYYLKRFKLARKAAVLVSSERRQFFRLKFGRKIERVSRLSAEQRRFVWRELESDLQLLESRYGVDTARWKGTE